MAVVMLLVEGADGRPTPYDNMYLAEYDPERDGVDPDGNPMLCHIVATPDIAQAKQYPDIAAMWEDWKRVCKRDPVRPDGKPNRPLTYFTITNANAPA